MSLDIGLTSPANADLRWIQAKCLHHVWEHIHETQRCKQRTTQLLMPVLTTFLQKNPQKRRLLQAEPSASSNPRGPNTQPRHRPVDASSGTPRLPDWTRFNVQISLRNLRSYEPTVIQKEIRKLHLRWWHASESKMRHILQAAGVDEARLAFIKPVCDTCRECRAWQRPGKTVMASVSLPTKFLQEGECDIMF